MQISSQIKARRKLYILIRPTPVSADANAFKNPDANIILKNP